jgi:excisionase family DNA binding protein
MAEGKRRTARPIAPTEALFVRIPTEQARLLDRAAFQLRRPKRAIVSELVERYVDPDSPASLAALGGEPLRASAPEGAGPRAEAGRRRVTVETLEPDAMVVGHHSFRPREARRPTPAPEVLRSEQAAELLQVTAATVERLAERGELPGRRLDGEWRFSRAALLAWLAPPAPARPDGADDGDR